MDFFLTIKSFIKQTWWSKSITDRILHSVKPAYLSVTLTRSSPFVNVYAYVYMCWEKVCTEFL